jgi:SAM-dependent methyltransferase
MDDPDAYRKQSRQGWNAVAAAWGGYGKQFNAFTMPVTLAMLEAAQLQPGYDVLELAAGPGDVGFMAHELIQPGGTLITSDFAPEMLGQAQARAEALGLTGVRFKQIDAESIDLDAASLDVVLVRWGFMLMADPGAALRETRRVLRPGGRLSLAAWTSAEDNRWSSVVGEVMVARGHAEPPDPDAPGQFAWGRPGIIEARLEEAGFVDGIEVVAVDFEISGTYDEWWERTMAMARVMTETLSGLPPDERAAIEAAVRERVAPYDDGTGRLVFPARSWVAGASA